MYNHQFLSGICVKVDAERGGVAPVEYKKGSMGKWLNDHIQLCAQAMCLEERLSDSQIVTSSSSHPRSDDLTKRLQDHATTRLTHGFVFYFGSRRRERVEFDQTLRGKTMETIERIWALLNQGQMPAPIDKYARCRECSLEAICLPREVRQLVA